MFLAETIQEKAARLIATGRVHKQLELPDGGTVWRVQGDSNKVRRVVVATDGSATCDCPALLKPCAHILAVLDDQVGRVPVTVGAPADELAQEADVQDVQDRPIERVTPDDVEVLDPDQPVETIDGHGTALEVLPPAVDLVSGPVTWDTLETISKTQFVPDDLRGKTAAILGAVLMGREYGLGPLEALRLVDVVDGRPAPSAELLVRLYRRAGHLLEVVESTSAGCKVTGKRADTGEALSVTYTIDDAVQAKLVSIDADGRARARSARGNPMPWELYTADMLYARAVSRLVRRLAPDCLDAGPEPAIVRPTGS
jgi:hypothetical protein